MREIAAWVYVLISWCFFTWSGILASQEGVRAAVLPWICGFIVGEAAHWRLTEICREKKQVKEKEEREEQVRNQIMESYHISGMTR